MLFRRSNLFAALMLATRYCPAVRAFHGPGHNIISSFVSTSNGKCRRNHHPENERYCSQWENKIPLYVHRTQDVGVMETIVGGERYEYVPIPNSMKSTTLFVRNLCEFVQDDDLSQLFQKVSTLQSVPACVARKADTTSLQYGFVSFPTVEEKEQAIIRFNNYEWRGKRLKVEEIKDIPNSNASVRVPGKLVAYVTGGKALQYEKRKKKNGGGAGTSATSQSVNRISRDDVDRLSRGQASKKRGYGSRSVPHRLNEVERAELDRAARKGYLSLVGGGNRRTRKGSPLANIHRQWCDARGKPQILVFKATGGGTIDQVIVDFSPLRLNGLFDDPTQVDDFMIKWKAQTMSAAFDAGMEFNPDSDEINEDQENYSDEENDNDNDDDDEEEVHNEESPTYRITLENTNQAAWATKPIWSLPMVCLGTFEGDRNQAKTMAKVLAEKWEIPDSIHQSNDDGSNNNHDIIQPIKSKRDGRSSTKASQNRKRGGGHRQEWF